MTLKIEIEMDNAAFESGEDRPEYVDASEPARILQKLIVGWKGTELQHGDNWTLRDINGNKVGQAEVVE